MAFQEGVRFIWPKLNQTEFRLNWATDPTGKPVGEVDRTELVWSRQSTSRSYSAEIIDSHGANHLVEAMATVDRDLLRPPSTVGEVEWEIYRTEDNEFLCEVNNYWARCVSDPSVRVYFSGDMLDQTFLRTN